MMFDVRVVLDKKGRKKDRGSEAGVKDWWENGEGQEKGTVGGY